MPAVVVVEVQLQLIHSLALVQHVVRLLKSYFVLLIVLEQRLQVWQPPVVSKQARHWLMRCSVARSLAAVRR